MGSMQKPDGSLRREETSAGSLQKPHLKLRLIPMRIHKRSVSLSRQAGRPFVALSRFCRWFQGVHKRSVLLWVRPQVVSSTKGLSLCRGRRAGLLSRLVVFVAGFRASTRGLPVCVIGFGASIRKRSIHLSRQAGRPFVATHRFHRWIRYLHKRSVRLCDRFRRFDHQIHKRSVRLCDRFRRFDHQKVCHFVAAVAAGGQAFCCD
jgi:5-methylcytosine-specific restriction endonuclease McrA